MHKSKSLLEILYRLLVFCLKCSDKVNHTEFTACMSWPSKMNSRCVLLFFILRAIFRCPKSANKKVLWTQWGLWHTYLTCFSCHHVGIVAWKILIFLAAHWQVAHWTQIYNVAQFFYIVNSWFVSTLETKLVLFLVKLLIWFLFVISFIFWLIILICFETCLFTLINLLMINNQNFND